MTGRLRSRAVAAAGKAVRRRALPRMAVLGSAVLLLAGCGAAPQVPATPSLQSPAVTVVTVPGLSSSGIAPTESSTTAGGVISETLGAPTTGEAPTGTAAASPVTAVTATPGGEPGVSHAATVSLPPAVSSRAPIPPRIPGAPTASGPSTVAVNLASCAGCRVIGAAAEVRPGLAVALATAPQGAVLLATRGDGAVIGVTNVPYGVTFPAPAGGALPCDRSGRCFVTAVQSQGSSVISVFQLAADGQWRDVTASGGFRSATSVAAVRDIDGDGLLDIVVQAAASSGLRWVAYHWSGDRFVVLGCAPAAGAELDAAAVSLAKCS